MGGHPYYYAVPYQPDINEALQTLRKQEFEAGRYNPVVPFLSFEFDGTPPPAPGKQHRSIEDALKSSDADGTRSILDVERIGSTPTFGVATPVPSERLIELYGTDKPLREMVATNMDFFEEIDRGQAVYIVLYRGDRPSEIFFAGMSYD
ncbi:MAG TPA: hypothetical protein VKD70_11205 [Candidatus Acidoferrum sp.]|nr:hypothetical protein [Candidatus Acidoferrum sp.]